MALGKRARFEALRTLRNVLEFPVDKRGQWASFFPAMQPLVLELACGRGEYALYLGTHFPHNNYIGVDIKGDRLFKGATAALEQYNVAFVRCFIAQLSDYFAPGELAEIWITFPDPYLSSTKMQKRLTYPTFLRMYAELLRPGGLVHLKTDELRLYAFTRYMLDLYNVPLVKQVQYTPDTCTHVDEDARIYIPTYYERKNISGSAYVYYLSFRPELKQFDVLHDKPYTRSYVRKRMASGDYL